MEVLRSYLKSITPAERRAFAKRCNTSLGYIRKKLSAGGQFGERLVISFERESDGVVRCESMLPEVDWAYIRGSSKSPVRATTRKCG